VETTLAFGHIGNRHMKRYSCGGNSDTAPSELGRNSSQCIVLLLYK